MDAAGELVAVEAVERGRTALVCPYCATGLIARKGRILAPHFAHDGATCRESHERAAGRVPFYDDFATLEPLERADLRLCAELLGYEINHTSLRGWRRAALARGLGLAGAVAAQLSSQEESAVAPEASRPGGAEPREGGTGG